jgi:transcriptional regulator with XRE-family HTH domain
MVVVEHGGVGTEAGGNGKPLSGIEMFAKELKAHRSKRGWTQVQLGAKMGYSDSYVSDVERADRLASIGFAEKCDDVFETPGTFGRLHGAAKLSLFPSWFAPVVPYEQRALCVNGWELGAIPGLLQSEDYARAQISATRPTDSREAIARLVSARIERQEIRQKEAPPLLWYVIDESAFRRVVGGREIMDTQLDGLIRLADDPNVIIQVLTFCGGAGIGSDGPMAIFEFPDGAPVVGYTECYRGGRLVEDPAEASEMLRKLSLIRASALSPAASVEWIRKVRREFNE